MIRGFCLSEGITFEKSYAAWQSAHHDFSQVVKAIPAELRKKAGVCGEWSCQQIVAHLAGWQREALKRYRDFQQGDSSNIRYEIDQFNASSVAALKLFNWKETLETFADTCEDLELQVGQLSPETTAQDARYAQWMIGLARDLREHTQQIKDWLVEQKDSST